MPATAYSYIRFSTPEQIHGGSLQRQLERSMAYVKEHGLILDDKLNMRDLGISAFRKANLERGNLGVFIKAIDSGLVKPGSYLIVESLDRLSRAEVLDALEVFLSIVRKGVIVVTLVDNRLYSRESILANYSELIVSIAVMARSHDESRHKSDRRKKSWGDAKVKAQEGKKVTRKIPFWLFLPDKNGEFQINEEGAETVRLIFDLAKMGFGYLKISQELNRRGIPSPAARTYKKKEGKEYSWGTSSVGHVLASEAVIGNFTLDNKAAQPVEIKGYYPAIIDEELFYQIKSKGPGKRGRSSPYKTNLFTRLLKCGYCGGPMQVDAGKQGGDRRSNMMCQRGRRGFQCSAKAWHYEDFEEAFFTFVHEIGVDELVGTKSGANRLEHAVEEVRGRLEDNAKRQEKLLAFIEENYDAGTAVGAIKNRLSELSVARRELERELGGRLRELDDYLHAESRLALGITQIRELYSKMKAGEGQDRLELRYSVAEYIASIVETVEVYSHGISIPMVDVRSDEPYERKTARSFTVKFRSGMRRLVVPGSNWSFKLDMRRQDAASKAEK